jgi:hypothetical protein
MQQTKKPVKIYELINWLLGQEDKLPEHFIEQKSKLGSLVPYITEQLWTNINLVHYLNKHTNDLFNIPDPIEQLLFLKKLFKIRGINKWSLYQKRPDFKPDLIKAIEEKEGYDEGNARGKALILKRKFGLLETQGAYKKQTATKAAVKQATTQEDKKFIKDLLEQKKIQEETNIPKVDEGIYIKKLTQEFIDENELVLFDVSLLKKRNQVLFIFIDKNNHKKYYLMPFMAKIYISKVDGVIHNDYIEKLDPDKFNGYVLTDIRNYTRLKYMLNDSYKRIINGGQ